MSKRGRKSDSTVRKSEDSTNGKSQSEACQNEKKRRNPCTECFVFRPFMYLIYLIKQALDWLWLKTKLVLWKRVLVLDRLVSSVFEFALNQYWRIVGRFPNFLEEFERAEVCIGRLETKITLLRDKAKRNKKDAKEEIKRLNDNVRFEEREREKIEERNKILTKHISELNNEIDKLEKEKKIALQRLSEQVSVKLRDSNPNIADLNDEFRPTKLAEMFSELYDDEWTNAFALLENKFGEQDSIKVLLDFVMGAYSFCETKVAESWTVLKEWFLDMNIVGAQNTIKWLKDSRKSIARKKVVNLQKEYECKLLSIWKHDELKELLSRQPVKVFTTKCIELCLLMVTSDPPVVIECPQHEPFFKCSTSPQHGEYASGFDEYNENISQTTERGRLSFDKDLYKEYTCRGEYIDFIVWPTLFLHKGGPLLSKGVAQGTKKKR